MATMLKILFCFAALAISVPLWFPAMMWLFGMMAGLFGVAIGLFSALFALAIVGGVLASIFALPALLLVVLLVWLAFFRQRRLPAD